MAVEAVPCKPLSGRNSQQQGNLHGKLSYGTSLQIRNRSIHRRFCGYFLKIVQTKQGKFKSEQGKINAEQRTPKGKQGYREFSSSELRQ